MATEMDLKEKFWDELDESPFVMLGLAGVDEAHTQPMTAQFDDDLPNRIWFYTNRQNRLVRALATSHDAILNFSSKGHHLFASVHGTLTLDNDPAIIDKFWSPIVSAWYDKGREDPDLAMLRFDPGRAELWRAEKGDFIAMMASSIFRGNADEAARARVAKTHF
ncbi:pyridoxamine 5'-phosphate oxidase family protein [Acuticoccus sp. M5D2P5]|uniref:pyridoxamine 5'-phosphate oxidase family protein n=1 Tax=Acuticoccus kalidii TaxID=2910977 RepID=UPI001F3881DB|nr:pyridoxamine 5'-phosphate oxidase family protein [Acuticoccus kalidii]MCF3932297.1 pyridoxamine 5'-phosphate oxidase family protein [Acuticoccus kalidii]